MNKELLLVFCLISLFGGISRADDWTNFHCGVTSGNGQDTCLSTDGLDPGICQSPGVASFYSSLASCRNRGQCAASACSPLNSPVINGAKGEIGQMIDVGSTASLANMQLACSVVGKVMKVATIGAGAFRTTCGGMKKWCEGSCNGSVEALKKALDEVKASPACTATPAGSSAPSCVKATQRLTDYSTGGGAISDTASAEILKANPAQIVTTCEGYGAVLMQAGMNMVQTLAQGLVAGQCEKDSASDDKDACEKDPNQTICKTAVIDCTLAANQSEKVCICKANPRDPACSTLATGKTLNANRISSASTADLASQKGNLGALDGIGASDGIDPVTGKGGGGTNTAGSGRGGGPPGGGGGSGGAPPKKGDGGNQASRFNTNILGSEGGGGAGGGKYGNLGNGKDANAPGGKRNPAMDYKQFLPGGAKAGAKVGLDGITGPSGMSLWEKVSNRYRENRNTLEP